MSARSCCNAAKVLASFRGQEPIYVCAAFVASHPEFTIVVEPHA